MPTWGELKHGVNATRPCPYDAELAAHYGVPFVRPIFPQAQLFHLFDSRESNLFFDSVAAHKHAAHPVADGHALIAAALRGLLNAAWGAPPQRSHGHPRPRQPPPLPPPLYSRDARVRHSELHGNSWRSTVSGDSLAKTNLASKPSPSEPNYELPSSLCMSGAELAPYVLPSTRNFHAVVEGSKLHPKPGYVARHVGARLSLCNGPLSDEPHIYGYIRIAAETALLAEPLYNRLCRGFRYTHIPLGLVLAWGPSSARHIPFPAWTRRLQPERRVRRGRCWWSAALSASGQRSTRCDRLP